MVKQKKSKIFDYNLKSVLKVREIKETLQKEALNTAEKKLVEEQDKEKKIKKDQDAEHQHILDIYSGGKELDLNEIQLRKYRLDNLKVKFDEQQKETQKAETKRDDEKDKLIDAVKDRSILEKDESKKKKEWKNIMDKEQMKFLDDIASTRFVRKNKEDHS